MMPRKGPVTAIVPMKGRSVRVPRKNIRPLAGRPLYHWVMRALMGAELVSSIVVETDSDEIAADAAEHFPRAQILRRPESLVGDEVPMNALLEWHISQLPGDVFLQTHATNPLLNSETIDAAVRAFWQEGDHDSLFTVTRWQTRFYWEDGRAINHNPEELLPTQNLPVMYEENSNIYIFTRESFAKKRRRIGVNPLLFPMDTLEAVDIDLMDQFEMAEALMARRLSRLAAAAEHGHGADA